MIRVFLILLLNMGNVVAEEISFTTSDKATIYANYQQRGAHAVLLAHGAIFNKESWGDFEQSLLADNFTVLAIDFRGYNKSTQGDKPQALYEDILAGIQYLSEQTNINKITVLGASMGGKAAAKASVYSKDGDINQLILLSPATVYQPENLKGSVLFIASENEYIAPTLKVAFNKVMQPKQIKWLPGRAHAQHIFKTEQAGILTSSILQFLNQ